MGVPCLDGPPLQLILQHACADAHISGLIKVLLTSKSFHDTALAVCPGVIPVQHTNITAASARTFTTWVAKYGRLVSAIDFSIDEDDENPSYEQQRAAIEQHLAAALCQAAKCSSTASRISGEPDIGLYLRTCKLRSAGPDIAAVLGQLPGCSLTNLSLHQPPSSPSDYISTLSSSLLHLTNLSSLQLDYYSLRQYAVDPLLQQLSALMQLTSLNLSRVISNEALQHLPSSLKEFHFSWDHDALNAQLRLGHLTALTKLDTDASFRIHEGYVLPPNVVELSGGDIGVTGPLMLLSKLETLVLSKAYTHADTCLGELSALPSLTYLCLHYWGIDDEELVGESWRVLPVKELIMHDTVSWDTVEAFRQLTQLVGLDLQHSSLDCSAAHFAAALQQMRGLQWLCLGPGEVCYGDDGMYRDELFMVGPKEDQGGDEALVLFQALLGLTSLVDLAFDNLKISQRAAECLAESTAAHLTCLKLTDCGLDDWGLLTILRHASQLRELDVSENDQISNAVVSAVAKLQALQHFHYVGTGITSLKACVKQPMAATGG